MEHSLKIQQCYLIHILEGRKTFEVRKNDRDYQVGDTIYFLPLEDDNYNCYAVDSVWKGKIPAYKIVYIYSGNLVNQNHVVLGIEPIH